MKISTMMSYAGGFKAGRRARSSRWRSAGLDLVWVAEAYGFDGPSLMGYLAALTETVEIGAAILPIYTRTPTLIAMTAAGIDALSDGRFHLGLGASGPQVIEGFHGVPYTNPARANPRDHRDLPRRVARARRRSCTTGKNFTTCPCPRTRAPGWASRSRSSPTRCAATIPIWIAVARARRTSSSTAEVADGWIPILFIPERAGDVWGAALAAGRGQARPRAWAT